ncbi:MAG: ABC transporter substrate-binding protein [Betaproteobacteria bacterium]|nr:ABC transporter substrate-binding protein [Betaproteobacteria bacterium]
MKSRALPTTIGAFPGHEYTATWPRNRTDSELHRMKLASKRMASLILARFARGIVAVDMAPALVVKTKMSNVLSVMQGGTNANALRRLAERKLLPRFDFRQMTRLAMGSVWFKANRQQQRALEKGFRALLVRTYSASLSTIASCGMQLEVKPVRHSNAHDATVKTLITGAGRPATTIDYRMENQPNGWKVYDVLVDGVSLMTGYRETFTEEVRRSGIDGLIQVLGANRRFVVSRHDFQGASVI